MFGKDVTNKKRKVLGRKEKEIQVKKRLEELEKQRIQIQNTRRQKMKEKSTKSQQNRLENKKQVSNRAAKTLKKASITSSKINQSKSATNAVPVPNQQSKFSKARSLPPSKNEIDKILKEQKHLDPDDVFKNRKSQTIDLRKCFENYNFNDSGNLNIIDESNNWGNDTLNSSELQAYKKQQNESNK